MNEFEILILKGYSIDKDGEVFGPRGKLRLVLKAGYFHFSARIQSERKVFAVHRFQAYIKFKDLVFSAECVRHLDGNSQNNKWSNIEIGTHSQNHLDKPERDREKQAILMASRKRVFSDVEIAEIRLKRSKGFSYQDLMSEYSISSKGSLYYILNNKYKTIK